MKLFKIRKSGGLATVHREGCAWASRSYLDQPVDTKAQLHAFDRDGDYLIPCSKCMLRRPNS